MNNDSHSKGTLDFYGMTSLDSKVFFDAKFIKVFHHIVDSGPFVSDDDVMFNLEDGKFSVLKYVNEMFRYRGQYEMLIECPQPYDKTLKPGIVWWRQDEFPNTNMKVEDKGRPAKGFSLDSRSTFFHSCEKQPFTGLSKSSRQEWTLFDGINLDNWWFGIGLKNMTNGIPCYSHGSGISLWVRVPSRPDTKRGITIQNSIVLFLFSFIIVSDTTCSNLYCLEISRFC